MDGRRAAAARLLRAYREHERARITVWGVAGVITDDARSAYSAAKAELEAAELAADNMLRSQGSFGRGPCA